MLAHALGQLGPLPERVLMVGDRRHDVHGAAAHGIDAVVVGWGYGKADFPERRRATGAQCMPRRSTNCGGHWVSTPSDLHVTFVCTGNICRSVMAEKMFADQIRRRGLADAVRVTSAGTGHWHVGECADERATGCCAPTATHASTAPHRSTPTTSADLVVALDRNHAPLLRHLGVDDDRIRMLRSFDPRSGAHALDVDDPYYGDTQDFETPSPSSRPRCRACTTGSMNGSRRTDP